MSLVDQKRSFDQMVGQGMSVQEAYQRAFPNGLTQEQIQKEQASAEQKAGLMQLAGSVAGVVAGTEGYGYIADALSGGSKVANTTNAVNSATNATSNIGAGTSTANAGNYTLGTENAINNLGSGGVNSTNAVTNGAASYVGPALGAVGAGAGAYGLYDVFKNKKSGTSGALQGGLSAGGLGMGLSAMAPLVGLGPLGWGAIAAMALLGGGAGYFGNFGDVDRFKTEGKALGKLRDKGFNIPHSEAEDLRKGRSVEELVAIEQQKQAAGGFGNSRFAQSRNEADLTPLDIQGYANLYEQAGAGQENNLRLRMELAKAALANQAVREQYGTVNVDWNKVSNLQEIMKQYGGLGDKGALNQNQVNDYNKQYVQQYAPQLQDLYPGAFKSSPSTSNNSNTTNTSNYTTQEGKSPDWFKKIQTIKKPRDDQKKIVEN
jgi:hypothetical protein